MGCLRSSKYAFCCLVAVASSALRCDSTERAPSSAPLDPPLLSVPEYAVDVVVVDGDDQPVSDAAYIAYGLSTPGAGTAAGPQPTAMRSTGGVVDSDGRFSLVEIDQTILVVVEAEGYFSSPVVLDRSMVGSEVRVTMVEDVGPAGERRVCMHFAGDAMLGRRYIDPVRDDTAVVTPGDGGDSARAVVAAAAPLFRAAGVRSLNLETVVGTLTIDQAYPKKRFLLISPPETVDLLDELAPNVITLGNNHARDWLDLGVASTVDALKDAGFPCVGAGRDVAEAEARQTFVQDGYLIGSLSYTSVNGDFVNDSLPLGDPPPSLPEKEAWQYEERSFGFTGPTLTVPTASQRIGAAWREFKTHQGGLAEAELTDYWAALVAVYPELQDWVARRGHGGANPYDRDRMEADIDALKAQGCDLIIVQLHSGFQFLPVKSKLTESAAHRAIDRGAHLVICHHPHVLQGFEWYKGRLIAYSLGNFIFDQDFLATFPSGVVRVIFEEDAVIEARFYPFALERYRPVPLGGATAEQLIQMVRERSVQPLRSERTDLGVISVERSVSGVAADFELENNSALILEGSPVLENVAFDLTAEDVVDVASSRLIRSRGPGDTALPHSLFFGQDLFGWGSFEDDLADAEARGGAQWQTNDTFKRIEVLDVAPSGVRSLRLRRSASNSAAVLVRPVARITFPQHRSYVESTVGVDTVYLPSDGEARYSVHMQARLTGDGIPSVRFDVYDFDDTDPTTDPESNLLRREEFPLDIDNDDAWHSIHFEPPSWLFDGIAGLEPNAVMMYVQLSPPLSGTSVLLVDDLRYLEWRRAADLPDMLFAVDALRSEEVDVSVTLERTPR